MIDVVVLFFVLGLFARLVKSDLRLPEALYEALSIYLLLAIGLKGGIELSREPLLELAPEVLAAVALSFVIPFLLYGPLRIVGLPAADSAALGAHFGSVSVVTFAVALTQLNALEVGYERHAPLWVALMEGPGLVAGALLARLFAKPTATPRGAAAKRVTVPALLRDVVFGKSVLLLLGGLTIGAVAGEAGTEPIQALFIVPFKGILALFLLELGLLAGARIGEIRRLGAYVIGIGVLTPPMLAIVGLLTGWALGLSEGGIALFATLAASASYIAAPTAMRSAVPQANPALSIAVALGVTFPFNILIGVPIYVRLASWLAGS